MTLLHYTLVLILLTGKSFDYMKKQPYKKGDNIMYRIV